MFVDRETTRSHPIPTRKVSPLDKQQKKSRAESVVDVAAHVIGIGSFVAIPLMFVMYGLGVWF